MVSGGTGENDMWSLVGQVRMVCGLCWTGENDMWSLMGQVRMVCGLLWDR